jgi:hypothetical protein
MSLISNLVLTPDPTNNETAGREICEMIVIKQQPKQYRNDVIYVQLDRNKLTAGQNICAQMLI